MESQYLVFEDITDQFPGVRKTRLVNVISKHRGNVLGQCRWHGPWRQYVFAPNSQTVFNVGCMEDINAFIRQMMEERKQVRAHQSGVGSSR